MFIHVYVIQLYIDIYIYRSAQESSKSSQSSRSTSNESLFLKKMSWVPRNAQSFLRNISTLCATTLFCRPSLLPYLTLIANLFRNSGDESCSHYDTSKYR